MYKQEHSEDTENTQFLTFPLTGHWFTLPSQQVLKVVDTPTAEEGGLVELGFVQLAHYSIQLLNLPELLMLKPKTQKLKTADSSTPISASENADGLARRVANTPFLVVLKGQNEALFGITLQSPPDLIEIPNHQLQPVPTDKRQTGTLQWINHVVPYNIQQKRQVLLGLDLPALLSHSAPPTHLQ